MTTAVTAIQAPSVIQTVRSNVRERYSYSITCRPAGRRQARWI
jgi:hypothetical protein